MNNFIEFMQDNTAFWGYLLPAVVLGVVFWVAGWALARKVMPRIVRRIDEDKHPYVHLLVNGYGRPVGLFLRVLGVCLALLVLANWQPVDPPANLTAFLGGIPAFVETVLRVAAIVCVTWGLLASSDIIVLLMQGAKSKLDIGLTKSVRHFLTAIFRVVVILIGAIALLGELNFDVYGLVAGLGIGGLVLALAAQDSASNFFGGLVIVIEKPFEIGDRIICGDVDGVVEDISLRSTKVRAGSGALIVVPNSQLSGAPILNWSGEKAKRLADFGLTFTQEVAAEQMRAFCEDARKALTADPEVVPDSVIVRFSEMGESGPTIRVAFQTTQTGLADHLRIRERANYALLELAGKSGLQFAFPTRSVYLRREPEDEDGNA